MPEPKGPVDELFEADKRSPQASGEKTNEPSEREVWSQASEVVEEQEDSARD